MERVSTSEWTQRVSTQKWGNPSKVVTRLRDAPMTVSVTHVHALKGREDGAMHTHIHTLLTEA